MNFIVTWVMDKLGYMPKIAIDSTWPFPATPKAYTPHEFEQSVKNTVAKKATKVAKKPTVPKATTRKKK